MDVRARVRMRHHEQALVEGTWEEQARNAPLMCEGERQFSFSSRNIHCSVTWDVFFCSTIKATGESTQQTGSHKYLCLSVLCFIWLLQDFFYHYWIYSGSFIAWGNAIVVRSILNFFISEWNSCISGLYLPKRMIINQRRLRLIERNSLVFLLRFSHLGGTYFFKSAKMFRS